MSQDDRREALLSNIPDTPPHITVAARRVVAGHATSRGDESIILQMLGLEESPDIPDVSYPCRGGCGKMLRPNRRHIEIIPGTVQEKSFGLCSRCHRLRREAAR